jgi:CBS domain-containing protein
MSRRAAWRLESLGFDQVFDYVAGKLDWLSSGLPVEGTNAAAPTLGAMARRDVPTCRLDDRVSDVSKRLGSDPTMPCVVINDHRIVLGLLRSESVRAGDSKTVEELMLSGPVTFRPNAALDEIDRYLRDHTLRYALVTTSDGELIGLASSDEIRSQLPEPSSG